MKFGLRYASLGRSSNGPAAVELAQAAEAAGFDSIWTVEHVVVPHGYQSRYPYSPSGRMGSGLEDFPIPDPPAQVKTPDDVLRYGKEMIARFR